MIKVKKIVLENDDDDSDVIYLTTEKIVPNVLDTITIDDEVSNLILEKWIDTLTV